MAWFDADGHHDFNEVIAPAEIDGAVACSTVLLPRLLLP